MLCCLFFFFNFTVPLPDEKIKKFRRKKKPIDFGYHKWAHLGVPMLISAGDDTKLFAYSVMEFTNFSPHDICPAPQKVPIQLVLQTAVNRTALLLVQTPYWLDILSLHTKNSAIPGKNKGPSGSIAPTELLVRVKASQKIICSTICSSGALFAYPDHVKPGLFKMKRPDRGKNAWAINKMQLPQKLLFAHAMVFSFKSSHLIIARHDRKTCG